MILQFYKDQKEMMAMLKHIRYRWEKAVSILIKKGHKFCISSGF